MSLNFKSYIPNTKLIGIYQVWETCWPVHNWSQIMIITNLPTTKAYADTTEVYTIQSWKGPFKMR